MTKAGAQVRIRFGVSKRANQFPIQRTHFIAQCSQIYTEKYKLFLFVFFFCYFCKWVKVNFSNVQSNNEHTPDGRRYWMNRLYLTETKSTVTAPVQILTVTILQLHNYRSNQSLLHSRPVDSFWYRFQMASMHYAWCRACMLVDNLWRWRPLS